MHDMIQGYNSLPIDNATILLANIDISSKTTSTEDKERVPHQVEAIALD